MKAWFLLKKEIYEYFNSSIAYIVMVVFLALAGYFFYTDVLYFNLLAGGADVELTKGVWQPFFLDMRLVFFLTMPLLTMRLIAEEKKTGSIELLCTLPITEMELLAGKFLAPLVIFFITLAMTLIYPAVLSIVWPVAFKPLVAAYLGFALLGTSLIACGLFISSLTDNQVVAATGTMGIMAFFWFITWNEAVVRAGLIDLMTSLSIFDRSYNFFAGVINTKDGFFFLAFTAWFLFLAWVSLRLRRVPGRSRERLFLCLVVGTFFFCLVVSVLIADRLNHHYDLTPSKRASISPQTLKVLKGLSSPVRVALFYQPGERFINEEEIRPFADQCSKFHYDLYNLDRHPQLAREHHITRYGEAVVSYGGKNRRISHFSEEKFLSALLELTRKGLKRIYFVQGHGEKNINSCDQKRGYSNFKAALYNEGYELHTTLLVTDKTYPRDSILAFCGPRKDITEAESDRLKHFLHSGGRVLVLADPAELKQFRALMSFFRIELKSSIVVDDKHCLFPGDYLTPIVFKTGKHEIVNDISAAFAFPVTQELEIQASDTDNGVWALPIVQSSAHSWSVSDIRKLAKADAIHFEKDNAGPFTVGAVAYIKDSSDKYSPGGYGLLAVFGDADFANNYYIDVLGNRDLLLNAVNWLSEDDRLVSVRSKKLGAQRKFLRKKDVKTLFLSCVLAVPVIVLLTGILAFFWRRRKG